MDFYTRTQMIIKLTTVYKFLTFFINVESLLQ